MSESNFNERLEASSEKTVEAMDEYFGVDGEDEGMVEEAVEKVTSWLPLASQSPDPEREEVDEEWNEVSEKFVNALLDKTPEGVPENAEYVAPDEQPPEDATVHSGPGGAAYVTYDGVDEETGGDSDADDDPDDRGVDDYRRISVGEASDEGLLDEGGTLAFGDVGDEEILNIEDAVNDPMTGFGPNAGYVELEDGTYANLMGDVHDNMPDDATEENTRSLTDADGLAEPDPEVTGSQNPDDWNMGWEGEYAEFSPDRDLVRLSSDEKRQFQNEWSEAAPEEGVQSVESTLRTIKGSTMNTQGQKFDKLMKETHGVAGEPRSSDMMADESIDFEDADDPTPEEIEAMEVFTDASQKFFEENFGEEATIHRGLGDHAKEGVMNAVAEWYLEDGDDTFEMKDNPASVWTTDDKMADSYGKLKANQEISSDEVLAMPEALLDFDAGRGPDWNEGEVNVSGADRELTPDDLTLTSGHGDYDVTLREAMENPVEVYYEHDAGTEAFRNLASEVANHGPPELAYELHREIFNHNGYNRDDEDMSRAVSQLEEAGREVINMDEKSQVIDLRQEADWLREARNRDEEVEEMADKFLERLLKNRVYLDDPSDAPDGALVRQGRSGRWYYDTSETQRRSPTRIYVSSPEQAPDSVTVRGGENGGYFYYRNESPRGQY